MAALLQRALGGAGRFVHGAFDARVEDGREVLQRLRLRKVVLVVLARDGDGRELLLLLALLGKAHLRVAEDLLFDDVDLLAEAADDELDDLCAVSAAPLLM